MTPNKAKLLYCKINQYIEQSNGNKYLTLVAAAKIKNKWPNMKNYGIKSKALLDIEAILEITMIRNILKSNLIQMSIYL